MNCPSCGGACETTPSGLYARCTRCQKMYTVAAGALTAVTLPTGTDPALFAAGVGFATQGASAGGGMELPPDPMTAMKNAFAEKASNVGVRAKVGGVQVDLSKGGVSVDTSKLEKKIEQKVERTISGWIWGCVFTVVFFGLFAGIVVLVGGYVGWAVVSGGGPSAADEAAAAWDGKTPFVCPPNGSLTLSGVTADLSGTAITAGGNCQLTLEGVNLTADVGISAGGNAKVTVIGGSVKGRQQAISAMGNALVTVDGAHIDGAVEKLGGAKVNGI